MKLYSRVISTVLIVFISTAIFATKKDCRFVKRKYPQSYAAIEEWSIRKSPQNENLQKKWLDKQCVAFRILAEKWKKNAGNDRKIIKHALLRWGWLLKDSFPDTPAVIDYHLVYMEYRQKTE